MFDTERQPRNMGTPPRDKNQMPGYMVVWFYVTAVICTIDASFIVFRPRTLPGGDLSKFFSFYQYYIYTDQRYNDVGDSYVFTQSLMNYVEVVLNIITLICHYRKMKDTRLLAFTVSVMTFWKTVLYILMFYELAGGKDYRVGNSLVEEIFIVLFPNGVWIVLPLICMVDLWRGFLKTETKTKLR
ncbi:uncharacterized protein LOC123557344 isoform X2 [Mercenaria mercenaria]|uniref:uncharacterized protein LOC123557344 isoform X2 n=1 Tax=Mercenaria mercenaria TaxID=6596 RepID=UPI00234F3081|nr:uncharacterized protein LOC123557344 isoform X2 [Mercenaria mercenaria]